MTDDEDIEGLAAEYALGTLDAGERASVAARRLREPQLDRAINGWERRLSPLVEVIKPVSPPGDLIEKIQARLSVGAQFDQPIIDLRRRLRIWKSTALVASALAASLVAFIGMQAFEPQPKQQNLVAVLQKDAASPAFLVTVNIEDRTLTVQPVAAKPQPGKSYELWLVQDSLGAPKSLGVIDNNEPIHRPTLAAYKPDVIESGTFAVSLEPEGGSPTGAPTGPVVFSGKLIPVHGS